MPLMEEAAHKMDASNASAAAAAATAAVMDTPARLGSVDGGVIKTRTYPN